MTGVTRRGRGRPASMPMPRQTILRRAASLFAAKGYDRTSLQDIAADMGMSKAAIYYYFSTKQVMYDEIVADLLDRLYSSVKAAMDGAAPPDRLRRAMIAHADFFEQNYAEYVAVLHGVGGLKRVISENESAARRRYELLLREIIADGRRSGELVTTDPAMAARGVLSMINWMTRWFDPQGRTRAAEFANDYFEMIYYGLAPRGQQAPEQGEENHERD